MADEILTSLLSKWKWGGGRRVVVIMLLTLHLALWFGVHSIWARPLLFAHLGLFLMWQPIWRGEEKLSSSSALVIIGISTLALFWLNWWLLAFWVGGLFSIVGGRVLAFQSLLQRARYLLAMAYLLAVQLFWVTPQLFSLRVTGEASGYLMMYVLPIVLGGIALIPAERERLQKSVTFDLIYSLLLFTMLTLLMLGSLTFMSLANVSYFESLLRTLFLMALVLFVLGWLWNPRLGFSGFQTLFSRYFLNVGTPFELWIKQLAEDSSREESPEIFLRIASKHLAELPWLTGVRWSCEGARGQHGETGKYDFTWADQDMRLFLYARYSLAPAILMHIHLLCQVMSHFYHAKKSEQHLRELMRLKAVHETGARVTHDLKNMLQSLLVLISVVEKQPEQAKSILMNQLPVMANRIEMALAKLKIAGKQEADALMPLEMWWQTLQERQQYRNLEWVCNFRITEAQQIPYAMFDNILDNLIENARNKRMHNEEISITVTLLDAPLRLMVCDTGGAVSEQIATRLLRTVVDSEDGLGVGLFQAARWAENLGFRLSLQQNREGCVCFELREIK